MKTWFRRCHLALALISGLFILSLSISGALLVFGKEIQLWLQPNNWLISSAKIHSQQPLALSELVAKIALVSEQPIHFIERAQSANMVWLVRLGNGDHLNINPYNGDIVAQHQFYDTFYGLVMSWHRWLLLKDQNNNKPLQALMACASLLLMIELVIGCALWLKAKKPLKRLKIKWRSKAKALLYQLHTSIGVFCCVPLLLIAFSGMAFYWQPATQQVVEWLTMSKIQRAIAPAPVSTRQQPLQLDLAYDAAKSALINAEVYRIYLPNTTNNLLALRLKMPSESHAYSWSWADPYTGRLLKSYDASKSSLATKVWHFKYKFHIGDFFAWPVKLLWLLLSLMPSFLVLSGLYLYMKRWQKRRIARKHSG
ncbi:Uncharacterized iron-regulated membrane protein [Colwellia chukchiensis]|uniref:Uncharacterized iron-regulated membrane protein n=1 Tax=Colwellia chukchiensis TaxID=641665 RepID=A0A1H7GVL0_9GAMM|nr:PepSY-associated TM helix domain-containing protein [Colwellia chukchiensis]SEK42039.1 Uncharacterized iron-regulated membrane protein [Colwellia chukchiensis]